MPSNVALLVNPTSAKGNGARAADLAQQRLTDAGLDVLRLQGRDGDEALALARAAVDDRVDALVVCGGDGIVHLGTQAAAGSGVPLGIIPAGTGNDVARYLGIDRSDPERAADAVIAGETRTIDLGLATPETPSGSPAGEPRWFVTVATAGFGAVVTDRANRMTRPAGRTRYDIAMVMELAVFSPATYRLVYDDLTVETPAMMVCVGNGPSAGGGMQLTARASLHDGEFDIMYFPPMPRARLVRLFPSVFSGKHLEQPEIDLRRTRRFRISSSEGNVYADGELLGALPMSFEAIPDALNVIVARGHSTV